MSAYDLNCESFVCLNLEDRSSCSCLTVVNVTDSADIDVWFCSSNVSLAMIDVI